MSSAEHLFNNFKSDLVTVNWLEMEEVMVNTCISIE